MDAEKYVEWATLPSFQDNVEAQVTEQEKEKPWDIDSGQEVDIYYIYQTE